MRDERLTFASLYSGAGGLDIGFAMAGYVPLYSIDIDRSAVDTYAASFKRLADRLPHLSEHDHRIVCGDVDEHLGGLEFFDADVVVGGPPCQGFSVAGKMNPLDPRSRHVWRFLDAVEIAKPLGFAMENVKALATNRRWAELLDGLRARAEELGFETHVLVLNASHFGVPQSRERVFLVGVPPGTAFESPVPTTAARPPTVRGVLDALPRWRNAGNDMVCAARITPAKKPVMRRSPYAGMLFNGTGRPMQLDRPAPTLPATMGGNRTPIVDQEWLDGLDGCWVTRYHAHLIDGGEPFDEIPPRLRRVTVQEAAAIQGFAPDMEWRGSQSAIYRQVGNAVPPPLGAAVARVLGEALEAAT